MIHFMMVVRPLYDPLEHRARDEVVVMVVVVVSDRQSKRAV